MCGSFCHEHSRRGVPQVQNGGLVRQNGVSSRGRSITPMFEENIQQYQHPCFRCTGWHHPADCGHRSSTCRYCRKQGHIERACFKKKKITPLPLTGGSQRGVSDISRRSGFRSDPPRRSAAHNMEATDEEMSPAMQSFTGCMLDLNAGAQGE
ncbi:uncharacterized protein LOC124166876 [Ischnura elegans]|uniref:uncharacterized protein LOC124166876 n=1 Tax=Ischnura elegans TaxID=197161 RepID=UPI001ED88C6B|nr:uncharacterized protein LOC124166876 [Ischnura elegans]